MAVERLRQMTVAEYFAFDEATEITHEYIDGEIYPMTGGTLYHAAIMMNAGIALGLRLKGSDCRVLSSAMRHRVNPVRYLYPDLSVVCGEPATDEGALTLFNPTLVAEVTSPATAEYDRGDKRLYYQSIPSLRLYLVIDQHRVFVELYARQDTGWLLHEFSNLETVVPLPTLGCELPLADIYDGIQV